MSIEVFNRVSSGLPVRTYDLVFFYFQLCNVCDFILTIVGQREKKRRRRERLFEAAANEFKD